MSSKYMIKTIFVLNIIAMALAGCGKKKNNNDPIPPLAPAPVVVAPPIAPPGPGMDPSYWCYSQGGRPEHSSGLCQITTYHDLSWKKFMGTNNTLIQVYFNDQVRISASRDTRFYVAGVKQNGTNFTSTASGPLEVKGDGLFDTYRIRTVEISRCYNFQGQLASCY